MSTITLPNIRVSSDLQVRVRLKDGGVAIDWSTLSNIKACIYSDAQRALAGRCAFSIDEEDNTLLVCTYAANKPQYLGVNRIVISAKYMGETKTYDKPAFSFVRWTADQEGEEITIDDPDVDVEIDVEDISSSILQEAVDAANTAAERANDAAEAAEHMVDIHTGPQGKSAYEVAVDEGYVGTEEQWLASLKGDTGETPDITIGTVTTVAPGTPAAATMTGTPEDPVLNLTIPQGAVGATPAFTVGTVTTGAPGSSVIVTISGTAEAPVLNVTIPQGMQGNTGSSVDYPYELVNNLTTNDATKGLSAAQGVVLAGQVSQLELKVGDFADPTPTPTVVSGLSVGSTSIAPNANQTLYYIPVQAGVAFSFSAVYSDILRYGFTATTPAAYVAVTGYAAKNGASDSGVSHSFTPSAGGYFCMAFKNDALVSLTIVPSVVPIGGEVYLLNQKVTALTPAVAENAKDISVLDEKAFGKELSETYNITSGVNFSSPELEVNIPAGAKISLRITNSTNQDSHNCPVFFKDKDGNWNRVNAYNRYDNEFVLAYDAFKVYFVVSGTFISTDGTVLFELTNGGIVSKIDANTEAITSRDATVQTHTDQIGALSDDLDGVEQDVSSLDQRVTTLENGGLEIKDEVLEGYVTDWLDEHPEATTTVEDGSVTKGKLASSLDNTITYKIYNKADLASFLSSSSTLSGRIMGDIVIDAPIPVTDTNRTIMEKKVLVGGSLYLQANLFSNGMVNGTNLNLPNFVGVVFNGNGHNICYDDGYCVRGLFTNCVFLNCGLMGDGQFCQSAKFTNCRFLMSANHPFIDTYSGSDVRFTSCNWEGDNKATIVYMNTKTMDYYANFMKISFESCIMEGQGAFPLCSLTGGTVSFIDCYMEANNGEAVLFRTSSDPSPVANIYAVNTKLCGNPNGYIFYIPEDYLGSNLTCLVCDDCDLANGGLVNTTDLYFYRVTNIHIRNTANSSYQPSEEISKVDSVNSIVNFTNNTTCVVKKFPCLLSFETNESGYKGNLYYIDLLTGNTPFVKCVSDPSKTPSIAYDSGTGYCTVTLHSARTSSRSCSAIHLSALRNQLVANDTYGYRSQYDV